MNSNRLDSNLSHSRRLRVALVYDRVNKWGGAERVLLALHKIFPEAPLYTSVYSKEGSSWAKEFEVNTSFLQSASALRKYNELLALFMPIAFEHFSFDEYDLVISVTSEAAKGIITNPGTVHICYCLTPTRYLWSGYDEYFPNPITRFLAQGSIKYLKNWDRMASQRPDHMIAISSEVKNRIKKYYDRDSEIIFPPLMIDKPKNIKKRKNDYFLLVSRMSRFSNYKRVDLAVEAFNQNRLPLKIIGGGPMMSALKKRSNKNIQFLGELTDEKLRYYYKNCKALIFPGNEDFGLVMAEAQLFGKPVIAFKNGGALDIVITGVTGEFFSEQSPESLNRVLERFDERLYNTADIVRNSERFSYKNFKKNLEEFLEKNTNL